MNLFELFVKVGVDDQASGKLSKLSKSLGNGLATAAKIGTAAVTAAAAGITALTTAAVKNYAEYEQLVGGAKLMFEDAYSTVAENAANAFSTVQMSQNEYLQQVNGFATGLKTALDGNEQAAADLAHRIIKAEADIVAATGNAQENVQNAFNGIMKSNFTMLDNLQIGITPTKEGFQEVIDKVNEWNEANGRATEYQMGNLADMQSALVDYIEMVGMSGYAQAEAAKTIQGSLAMAKGAWQNLLTGIADDNADFQKLVADVVSSVEIVISNVLPRVQVALNGTINLISGLAPAILEKLPAMIEETLPVLLDGAVSLASEVANTIPDLIAAIVPLIGEQSHLIFQELIDVVINVMRELTGSVDIVIDAIAEIIDAALIWLGENTDAMIKAGLDLLLALAKGITDNVPRLVESVQVLVLYLVESITNPTRLSQFFSAALEIITTLLNGLIDSIPVLVEAAVLILQNLVAFITEEGNLKQLLTAAIDIVLSLVNAIVNNLDPLLDAAIETILTLAEFLLDPQNIAVLAQAAFDIIVALIEGLFKAAWKLVEAANDLGVRIGEGLKSLDWAQLGETMIDMVLSGLKKAWEKVSEWISNAWQAVQDLFNGAQKTVEEVDASIAEANKRLTETQSSVDTFSNDLMNQGVNIPTNPYQGMGVIGNTATSGGGVVVNQTIVTSGMTPSEAMQEAAYQQELVMMR